MDPFRNDQVVNHTLMFFFLMVFLMVGSWKIIYKWMLMAGWWFGTLFIFHIYGIILPIDELIFFKMVKTTNQIIDKWMLMVI